MDVDVEVEVEVEEEQDCTTAYLYLHVVAQVQVHYLNGSGPRFHSQKSPSHTPDGWLRGKQQNLNRVPPGVEMRLSIHAGRYLVSPAGFDAVRFWKVLLLYEPSRRRSSISRPGSGPSGPSFVVAHPSTTSRTLFAHFLQDHPKPKVSPSIHPNTHSENR